MARGGPGVFWVQWARFSSKAVPCFPELVSECPDISFGKVELAQRCAEDKVSSLGFIGER